MIKNDLLKIVAYGDEGYIVALNYERFTQINFPESNSSLLVISNFKEYELSNTENSIFITEDLGGGNYVKDEVLVSSLQTNEYIISKTKSGSVIMVIKEELAKEVIIDNLIVVKDKKTAIQLMKTFGNNSNGRIKLEFEFTRDMMKEALNLIHFNGHNIIDIELQTVRNNIVNGNINSTALVMKLSYLYDINSIFNRENLKSMINNTPNIKIPREAIVYENSFGGYVGKDHDLIPKAVENELMSLLDERAKDAEDIEYNHSGYNVKEENYDYEGAFYELCDMLNSNHPIDGIIDISMNPKYRDAILDKNFELSKKKK